MIHSVFELGDTLVREVMVPRTDMVFIERDKTLRQALSLALRSGFSRIPVVGESEDDVVGIAYLKDLARRTYVHRDGESVEMVESVMRPAAFVPDTKPVDELLREMQASRPTSPSSSTSTAAPPASSPSRTSSRRSSARSPTSTTGRPPPVEELADGRLRVTARLHVDDLGELFGRRARRRGRRDGRRAARQAPRPGADPGRAGRGPGPRLTAESPHGRRNRIGTVLVRRVEDGVTRAEATAPDDRGRHPGRLTGQRGLTRRTPSW